MTEAKVIPAPPREASKGKDSDPIPPFISWDKSRRTLTVVFLDTKYVEKRIQSNRECFCKIYIPRDPSEYSVGEYVDGYYVVGFMAYAPISRALQLHVLCKCPRMYGVYRWLHNTFKYKHSLTHLFQLLEEVERVNLFGPFKTDLWRVIEKYNLRVHIPLP